jgi:signal transduction histidine kinase
VARFLLFDAFMRRHDDEQQQQRMRDAVATLSHEVRTPVHAMMLLAKLLAQNEQGNLTRRQVDYARTIQAAGADLLALVSDVLDLSKIHAGALVLDLQEVECGELLGTLERSFAPMAADKGLTFAIEPAIALPATFRTDRRRVQRILKNLLANAIKFTERGRVALTVERLAGGSCMAFRVIDTGIGISPSRHARIFEPFQQAERSTARQFGGTGLGLSISREIARVLGGDLDVQSAPGQGATFSLYVPR